MSHRTPKELWKIKFPIAGLNLTFDAKKGYNQTVVRTPYLPKTIKEHPPERALGILGTFETEYPETVFKIRFTPVNIEYVEDFFLETTTPEEKKVIEDLNKQLVQRKLRLDIYIPESQIKPFYDAFERAVVGTIQTCLEYRKPFSQVCKEIGLPKTEIMRILKARKQLKRIRELQ